MKAAIDINTFSGEVNFDEVSAAAALLLFWDETVHMAACRTLGFLRHFELREQEGKDIFFF